MAWSTPATFVDGNTLSAAQLNVLSGDLEHLYGLLKAAQPSFPSHFFNQSLTSANNGWAFRYRNRYIHYKVSLTEGTCSNLHLFVNGTDYTLDSVSRAAPYTWTSYIDVNAQGLTVGTIYEMYFTAPLVGTTKAVVKYLIQAEGTTL